MTSKATARRSLAVAAAYVLLLCSVGFQAAAAGIDSKEAELRQVRTRIESIRKQIHADAERRDALTGQLKEADLQIQSARERLAAVRPGLKVLCLSGYTEHPLIHRGVLAPEMAFLHKPFTTPGLLHKVREVLGQPDGG